MEYIIGPIVVLVIAFFVYKIANNYDKSKKRIEQHIKDGNILISDMTDNLIVIGDDANSFVNKIRPAQIVYNKFMAGLPLTNEEKELLKEVLKETEKTFPEISESVRDTFRKLANK